MSTPASTLPAQLLARGERESKRPFIEVFGDLHVVKRLSAAELADHMLAAAAFLRRECGVVPSDYVALLAHNSIAYLSVTLGAMALGATSLHLNYRQPVQTTSELLVGLAPRVLVASAPFDAAARGCAEALALRLVVLTDPDRPPGAVDSSPLDAATGQALRAAVGRVDPQQTAAVFFTGGTTGAPKAVPHTHASLLWLSDALRLFYPGGRRPRAQKTTRWRRRAPTSAASSALPVGSPQSRTPPGRDPFAR